MAKNKNNVIYIALISVIFGFFSGIVGEMTIRSYFLEDEYTIPFVGDIDFSGNRYSNSNLIIRDAKKVIVEQDSYTTEAIKDVSQVIVGIFVKKAEKTETESNVVDLDAFYYLKDQVTQGVVLTNDGWIVLDYSAITKDNIKNYVAITNNGEIYEIDTLLKGKTDTFSFVHLAEAKDLHIKKFSEDKDILNGQTILAVNWNKEGVVTEINKKQRKNDLIRNSDILDEQIIIKDVLDESFKSSAIFDMGGNIIGMVSSDLSIYSISNFKTQINSLLERKELVLPSLGVNYVSLVDLVSVDGKKINGAMIYADKTGVAVEKDSPAELAGLQANDIITKVNEYTINSENDLASIIQKYLPEEKLDITYLREDQENEIEIKLGVLN